MSCFLDPPKVFVSDDSGPEGLKSPSDMDGSGIRVLATRALEYQQLQVACPMFQRHRC